MLKPWEGRGVKTQQIQEMRALLAAQAAVPETGAPGFGRTLKTLFAPRRPPPAAAPLVLPIKTAAPHAQRQDGMKDAEPFQPQGMVLCEDERATRETVPPEVLLGPLAPRRPAFGQRTEPVLELKEPAPAEPHRLTLMGPDGAAVGEIILHAAERTPAGDAKLRRPFEPLHSETPFFPEDLADEPRARPARQPAKARPPAPELAATFLLATLAARLASEEAQLRERLAAAPSLAKAA